MHPILRNFLLVILAYAVFVMGGEVGVRLKNWNDQAKLNKYLAGIVDAQKKELEAERQDFYGGQTPDETLAMFIEAMQKGDYELARKYIASNDAKYTFDEIMKDENKIREFVESLDRITKSSTSSGYYMIADKLKKEMIGTISINKNLNGTWKITSL